MKFARLTAPNGASVWIAPAWVQTVRLPTVGEYPGKTQAVIVMSGNIQAVVESPSDTVAALESA
jgi:hypothetical protein